ncbi:hypothetical protein ABWI13_28830 [Streptomyces koyangensis]|uniref:hypothetical protein n=1 Tax=Streptomyces koyangensis TaxID=188770 RepID=UPI0033792945
MYCSNLLFGLVAQSAESATRTADHRTSASDARIALCIRSGVNLDDIDPASGLDYSRSAYEAVRASWVDLVAQHGASEAYTLPKLLAARSLWEQKRPRFTLGDDWFVTAFEAHRAFVASGGLPCAVRTCAVHYPARITVGPV